MAYIRIDPNELNSTAQLLRSCAVESAQIGTQLASCASCAMPAGIRGTIDQAVATIDRNLDQVATLLGFMADDLNRRVVAIVLPEFLAMLQAMLPAPTVAATTSVVSTPQSSASDDSGLLAVAMGKVRRNEPLTELDRAILNKQMKSDEAMGRKNTVNEAMEKYNANASTQSMMTSLQMGALNSAPDPMAQWFEPGESQIFGKVEKELGRPVGFLTDADKKYYAPHTYSFL